LNSLPRVGFSLYVAKMSQSGAVVNGSATIWSAVSKRREMYVTSMRYCFTSWSPTQSCWVRGAIYMCVLFSPSIKLYLENSPALPSPHPPS